MTRTATTILLTATLTTTLLTGCGGSRRSGGAAGAAPVASEATPPAVTYGALLTPRRGHQATHLGQGLVLVTGGETLTETATDTAELIDTRSGRRLALAARMTTPRLDHTAALLDDGRVLISGGRDAVDTPLDSAEVFDPRTRTFAAVETPEALTPAPAPAPSVFVGDPRDDAPEGRATDAIEVTGFPGLGLRLATPRAEAVITDLSEEGEVTHGLALISGGSGVDGRPAGALEILHVQPLEANGAFVQAALDRATLDARLAVLARTRAERDAFRAEATRLEGEIASVRGRITALEAPTAAARSALAQSTSTRRAAEATVARIEGQLTALDAENRRLEGQAQFDRNAAAVERRVVEGGLAAARAQLQRAQAAEADRRAALERVTRDVQQLQAEEAAIRAELERRRAEAERSRAAARRRASAQPQGVQLVITAGASLP